MASSATIRVTGLQALQSTLYKIDKGISGELRKELISVARIVSEEARDLAPQGKTTNLRRSIRPKMKGGSTAIVEARRDYFRRYNYSLLIHFGQYGTRGKRGPTPFLYDALQRKQGEVVRQLDERLRRFIESGFGRL